MYTFPAGILEGQSAFGDETVLDLFNPIYILRSGRRDVVKLLGGSLRSGLGLLGLLLLDGLAGASGLLRLGGTGLLRSAGLLRLACRLARCHRCLSRDACVGGRVRWVDAREHD